MECENDGGGVTTCGEYQGGPNEWCDNGDCDELCGPFADAEWTCTFEGQSMSCYDYGEYAFCGDGYCANLANDEDCDTCSQDCDSCPSVVCGDSECEAGETFRNCASDCEEPDPEESTCGDGICDSSEDPQSCDDCITPEEFCDGWDYGCPSGYECVGNQCVNEEWVGTLNTCTASYAGQPQREWDHCSSGYRCRQATNVWTQQKVNVCVPWDLN
jgi:hypothetical protein